MYYYYPVYIYPSNTYPNQMYRQFPEVETDYLHQSAQETRKLMREASIVLDKFATSKEFSRKVMEAAQESNMDEVKRLIKSLGITSDVEIYYNPDEIRMEFNSKVKNAKCCKLTVALRWR